MEKFMKIPLIIGLCMSIIGLLLGLIGYYGGGQMNDLKHYQSSNPNIHLNFTEHEKD